MRLQQLVNVQFQASLKKLMEQDMPFKTKYALKGIVNRFTQETTKYDEIRAEAIKRLGNKKEDGTLDMDEKGNVSINEENGKLFSQELTSLLQTEVEIGSVKIADLGDKIDLNVNDLLNLDGLVVD
jgi:hypothetical protein